VANRIEATRPHSERADGEKPPANAPSAVALFVRPASRIRYRILLVLCAMYFIAYVDRVNVSVAAPLVRKELGLTPTQLGFVFSAFAYPYAAMQVFGGWLSDRLGPRRVLAALSVVWAIGTILTGLSGGLATLVAVRVLVGIGEGGAFPAATRALASWMPTRERGFAQGITHSAARLGGAVAPPVVLAIAAAYGWRRSFVVLGLGSLVWTALWLLSFQDRPELHRRVTPSELAEIRETSAPSPSAGTARARVATPWRRILRAMAVVTLVDFCYGWSLWVFLTWLPSYLADARGFRPNEMGLMAALPLLAGVVGDTLGGVVSDAIYKRTGRLALARRALLLVGLLGALVFMVPAITTTSAIAAVWGLSLAFFFLELTNAVLWTLPLDIAGDFAGTAGGIMNTGFGVAGMISPVVFGWLIERTGGYRASFAVSVGLLAVGAVASATIDPSRQVGAAPDDRVSPNPSEG
jgi:ACS family D-galactonate transporter-like MFS transporter